MGSYLPQVSQEVKGGLKTELRLEGRVHACCAFSLPHLSPGIALLGPKGSVPF